MRIRRKTKRRIKRFLLFCPVAAIAWFLYLIARSPNASPPSKVAVEATPERVERGRYLFTSMAACDRCHSQRDFGRLYGPVIPSGRGAGRVMEDRGLPQETTAPNLTPDMETGLGTWTDGEKMRAIREGIGKDGRALYPLMPYASYRRLPDEDVRALVAYMNTLMPVKSALPKTKLPFFTGLSIKSLPQPVLAEVPPVDPGGGAVYGEFVAAIAGCADCHTPGTGIVRNDARAFSGGRFFETPYGLVNSTNITGDLDTGIGAWGFQKFAEKMRQFLQYEAVGPPKSTAEQFTNMPWEGYSKLTDEDMEALYLYLKTTKPISNSVDPHQLPGRR